LADYFVEKLTSGSLLQFCWLQEQLRQIRLW
jgi:hypothetical protein